MSRRFLEPTRRDVLIAGASLAAASACPPTPSKPDAGPRTLDPQPFDNATRVTFAPVTIPLTEALRSPINPG